VLKSFDRSILSVGNADIEDHVDCQASGQLYYGMLVRKAIESLKNAKTAYDNWYAKVYDKCNELLKAETGIKRPNKVDVENRVKQDYKAKHDKLMAIIKKREYVYERLNLWYSAWLSKGFSLSDLGNRRLQAGKGGKSFGWSGKGRIYY